MIVQIISDNTTVKSFFTTGKATLREINSYVLSNRVSLLKGKLATTKHKLVARPLNIKQMKQNKGI